MFERSSLRALVFLGLVAFVSTLFVSTLFVSTRVAAESPKIHVYKMITCTCCSKWIKHLKKNGLEVESTNILDVKAKKAAAGIPRPYYACHTAFVEGYFIEGHVPAADVLRLLKERPDIAGLMVPGMPMGSPGMEGPNPEPYDVLALDKDGKVSVYSSHDP